MTRRRGPIQWDVALIWAALLAGGVLFWAMVAPRVVLILEEAMG